jgi:uncharacterized membrane protein
MKENMMTIFGKTLGEYVAFAKVFLILIPLVGLLRLGLSLEGMPNSTVQWFSMTVLGFIGMVYFAIRVHTTGFGSYKQLLVIVAMQNLSAQVIAILGISLAIITGVGNIFSAPEFSFGGVNPWVHLAMHVFVGATVGALFPWAIGSLILAIARKVSPLPQTA